jgi:ubiquinone/menaquinone biosynthesis C-methylase UbiE
MKRYGFFILLLGFLAAPDLISQEKKIPVESSETWLNNQHQPEKLMDAIGLKEGMTIADIGAGRGRMTVWFADRVGENGKVYSNDIDAGALEYLEHRCQENNLRNVKTILGKVDDPLLPAGELDIAFMVSVYHHLDKPVEMLRNTMPGLKKDGILIIVERDPVKTGQTSRESTSRKELTRVANEAGYDVIKVNTDLLERDNIYFLKVK